MKQNNQKVYIFEGVDNTGKTNIAKRLAEVENIPYFKNEREAEQTFMRSNTKSAVICALYFADILKATNYSIILDRFHASEYVYAKTYNRRTDVGGLLTCEQVLCECNAVVVYCYKEDKSGYHDEYIDIDDLCELENNFDEFFDRSILPVIKIKTDDHDTNKQVERILGAKEQVNDGEVYYT